ncbi:MAG: hypothetical protein HRT35_10075 [Algicola sp.]|nr:hypothetical protein [Algicola sp.]
METQATAPDSVSVAPPAVTPVVTVSPFDSISAQHSTLIYRQFVQGKVMTKLLYNDIKAVMIENPLFTVLFNNQAHFEHLYRHLGYELCFHQKGDFYYVRELREDSSEEADDNALKVQTTLLLLGRYYTGSGRDLNHLCDPLFGLNDADHKALNENEEFKAILKAVRLDNWDKALDFITVRNFAFKSGEHCYFLSQAGKAFLFRLVEEYEG